jgi:hypothetical protein
MKPIDFALSYAAAGVPVFPVHAIGADGACSCSGKHPRCKPGKHPRTKHGEKDASTNPDAIRAWWRMWPDARIGADIEAAGIVVVASDAADWLAEFERRGLPADAPRSQSQGGEGHVHVLTRRPPGCPTTRICRSGEYDILSAGYAILPSSDTPGDGRYGWLTPYAPSTLNGALPAAPAWVVDMLTEAAASRERRADARAEYRAAGDEGDEPPIVLDGNALAVWRGERVKRTKAGDVDRSASLLWIGRVLYDNGMTRRGLVAELRARDERLGWRKYSDRADGDDQYHAIVDELEANGRNPEVVIGNTATDGGAWERRARTAEAQLTEIRELQSLTAAVRRNRHIRVVQNVAIALAYEIASAESRDAGGDGAYLVRLGRLGDNASCNRQTAGRHLATLESWGLLDRELRRGLIEIVNTGTGEVEQRLCRDLYVTLPAGPVAFLQTLAAYVPVKKPKPDPATCTPRRHCKTCQCADALPKFEDRTSGHGATSAPADPPGDGGIPNVRSSNFGHMSRHFDDPPDDETADGVRACAWCGRRTVGHELCAGCDPPGHSRVGRRAAAGKGGDA